MSQTGKRIVRRPSRDGIRANSCLSKSFGRSGRAAVICFHQLPRGYPTKLLLGSTCCVSFEIPTSLHYTYPPDAQRATSSPWSTTSSLRRSERKTRREISCPGATFTKSEISSPGSQQWRACIPKLIHVQRIPQPPTTTRRDRPIRQATKRPVRAHAIAHTDRHPSQAREPQRSRVRTTIRRAAGRRTSAQQHAAQVVVVE